MTLKSKALAVAGALALSAAAAVPSLAAPENVSASLTPSSEVPPAKSQAKGEMTGTYDPSTKSSNSPSRIAD